MVRNFQNFLTGRILLPLPLPSLILLPVPLLRSPSGAHSLAELSTPHPRGSKSPAGYAVGCLPALPQTQSPVPTGQVGQQRVEGADEEVMPQLYHRQPHQVPGKAPGENRALERTGFVQLPWSWDLCRERRVWHELQGKWKAEMAKNGEALLGQPEVQVCLLFWPSRTHPASSPSCLQLTQPDL